MIKHEIINKSQGTYVFQIIFKHLSSLPFITLSPSLSHLGSVIWNIANSYPAETVSIYFTFRFESFDSSRSFKNSFINALLVNLSLLAILQLYFLYTFYF